jgi:photosystem II stability/assembly factor-like uncharacterized protein
MSNSPKLLLLLSLAPLLLAQDMNMLKGLKWRDIGPFRGGRSATVTGVDSQPGVYYFGAVAGGVWKTTDGGVNWKPVSDGQPFGTSSIGDIAVSESDPNIVYAGTGEYDIRGNVSYGDGIYKSTDAGRTWKHIGLENTRQISRIRIHPRTPDIVYVAALGHVWGPNDERGIFRTKDGGKTWQRIFWRGPKAGAIDLTFDPTNANILYAAFWEVYRKPWDLESGGPGSGIFKSTDGGDTWTELTHNPGLPKGPLGNIGSQYLQPIRNAFGPWSKPKRAAFFAPTMRARPGPRSMTSESCASAPGITAGSLPTRKTRSASTPPMSNSSAPMTAEKAGTRFPLRMETITAFGSPRTIRTA